MIGVIVQTRFEIYQPSSLSPVKFSISPVAQASWHLSYSASIFAISASRFFTQLSVVEGKLEHQDRVEGFGQGSSIPNKNKNHKGNTLWNSALNRETHWWQIQRSFSSNREPMIGVFQASKSCWGETFSSFLSSDRGMRNRPSMSFHVGLPKMSETYFELQKSIVGNITSMHGGLKVLVNLGLVQLLFTRLGIPILSSIKSIKAGAKVRSRIHVSLINQFRVPRYIVFFGKH